MMMAIAIYRALTVAFSGKVGTRSDELLRRGSAARPRGIQLRNQFLLQEG
jgi:hypothetical protein